MGINHFKCCLCGEIYSEHFRRVCSCGCEICIECFERFLNKFCKNINDNYIDDKGNVIYDRKIGESAECPLCSKNIERMKMNDEHILEYLKKFYEEIEDIQQLGEMAKKYFYKVRNKLKAPNGVSEKNWLLDDEQE